MSRRTVARRTIEGRKAGEPLTMHQRLHRYLQQYPRTVVTARQERRINHKLMKAKARAER